jgi:hypothetical protein
MSAPAVSYYETPLVQQAYRHRNASETPVVADERVSDVQSGPTAPEIGVDPLNVLGDATPSHSDLDSHTVRSEQTWVQTEELPSGQETALERVAAQRAILLAKRYALRTLTREQQTRLEILNQRLKVLLPPVTEAELQLLEAMANLGRADDAALADIRARHNLG